MATELFITFYIIDLSTSPFSVTIERSKIVDQLKEAIVNGMPNKLKGVDPNRLTLYKTEVPDDENIGQSAKDAPKEELKVGSRRLFKVFPIQPPEETVNVFVKAPRTIFTGFSSATFYEAAKKLYDAMWRKDLQSRLRDVQVSNGKALKFLPATEVDDLQLQQLGCPAEAILFREEYSSTFDILSKHPAETGSGGMVVTGGSGIGKSVFLFYTLLQRLSIGQPVALQHPKFGEFVVLFHENGVEMHNPEHSYLLSGFKQGFKEQFWALSVSTENRRTPCLLFQSLPKRQAWIVQTTPPARDRWKGWRKECDAGLFIMKSFSEDESEALGDILGYSREAFLNFHRKWGGCARTCVNLAKGIETEGELETTALTVASIFAKNPDTLTIERRTDDIASHYVFTLSPREDDRAIPVFQAATPYLFDLVMNEVIQFDAAKQASFYVQASRHLYLRGVSGYIFEQYLYTWLSLEANADNVLSCTAVQLGKAKSTKSKVLRLQPVGKDNVTISSAKSVYEQVDKKRAPSFAWIPDSRVQASFDAAIFTDELIVTIQVTVAAKHSMKPPGFEEMEGHLPEKFKKQRARSHVFITDRSSNVDELQRHRYKVAEDKNISVYVGQLEVSKLKLASSNILERTIRVDDEVVAMDSSGMEMGDEAIATDSRGMKVEAEGSRQAQQRFEKREGKKAAVHPYATRQSTRKRPASSMEESEE